LIIDSTLAPYGDLTAKPSIIAIKSLEYSHLREITPGQTASFRGMLPVLRTPTIVRSKINRWQRQLRTTVGATRGGHFFGWFKNQRKAPVPPISPA